ncbi:type II toxin-antitoxin system HicB family antitoxin [Xylanimonas allomyrinae]|uniref:Type II toxin-antitoxin system HicB family antitoxin n=1 Tax=Xylanimonas allomyrinae TaxID=2509459 RepID=A0A4V0YE51_9MICO|nr:type II toxin-antitoxin system HicB family antitoxin [Xylanimonas allomyrinae]QAY62991.1 type II toxin-antitoxin system HicB family antitoxin [Xylanimonas allomyrinae]
MNAADRYCYRVTWSAEDQKFAGTVLELPLLCWLGPDRDSAIAGIQRLAYDVVERIEAKGRTVPVPLADRNYSGEFRLRISPETHRRLTEKAAEQRVSLNQLVSDHLALV